MCDETRKLGAQATVYRWPMHWPAARQTRDRRQTLPAIFQSVFPLGEMTEEGWLAESLQRENAMKNRFQGLSCRIPFFLTLSGLQPFLCDTRIRQRAAQYTSTRTAACSADFTTSSNLRSRVIGSLSFAATSGTDSRKLRRRLLFTA